MVSDIFRRKKYLYWYSNVPGKWRF